MSGDRLSGWNFVAAEHRFPRGLDWAAHRMLVAVDPSGKAVRQLNGHASWFDWNARCWRHKPIGYLPTDRLRAYDSCVHPRTWLPIHGVANSTRDIRAAVEQGKVVPLVSGMEREACENRLAVMGRAIRSINALNSGPEGGSGVPYPFIGLGRNSNSVFSTLLKVIGLEEPTFANPAKFTPGVGKVLLSEASLAAINEEVSPSLA